MKYSRNLAEQVAALVGEGVPAKHAAAACGIGESTYHDWRGKYPEFLELLEQKRGEAIRARIAIIQQAAEKGSWQGAAWWLERQCPEEFSLRPRVPVQAAGNTLTYEERLAQGRFLRIEQGESVIEQESPSGSSYITVMGLQELAEKES